MFRQRMQTELNNIAYQMQMAERELARLPEVPFYCETVRGGNVQWLVKEGQNKHYLSKKEKQLALRLVRQKYLRYLMEDLQKEYEALQKCCGAWNKAGKAEKLMSQSSYRKLLEEAMSDKRYGRTAGVDAEKIDAWVSEEYATNPHHPENLKHYTISGHTVRSKSEVLIASCLHMHQVPFRYEAALEIGGKILYPDFTMLHPQTGEILYWEHFGLMDDAVYRNNALEKLATYGNNGIHPGGNLILTYEISDAPLSIREVEAIVRLRFEEMR